MTYNKRNRTVLGLSLAASLIALGACGGSDGDSDNGGAATESTSQSSETEETEKPDEGAEDAPAPDLEGIPDVVAEVNGEEVTKDEFVPVYEAQFQQAASQSQMSGEAPDEEALKKQTIDSLVDTELLTQEAGARDFEVSEEDVDAELTSLAEQNQMKSADELLAAVEEQGTSEEQAREQIGSQLLIEQLVADEAGDIEPTEAELRKIYDDAKLANDAQGKQAQKLPPFAKVKSQIVEQAKSEKQAEVAQTLVEGLRDDADITVNL